MATFLSFLWPGLGQAYERRRRAALIFAVPALIVAGVLLTQAARGLDVLAIEMITPTFALTILILVLLLGAWRLVSMVEAAMTSGAPREWRRLPTIIILAALSAIVLLTHGAAAYYAYGPDAGKTIFVGEVTPTASTAPNGSATPRSSDSGSATPADNSVDFRGHHWKRRPPPGGSTSCSLASIRETAAITR